MNTEIPADDAGPHRADDELRGRPDRRRVGQGLRRTRRACRGCRRRRSGTASSSSARRTCSASCCPRATSRAPWPRRPSSSTRGIARCVLLGNPDEIRDVAAKQGVTLPGVGRDHRPGRGGAALRRPARRAPQGEGHDARARGDRAAGSDHGRHHDARARRGGRPRVGRHPQHGAHHPAGAADHQDRAGLQPRVERLLHVPARAGAGLRRLRRRARTRRPSELADIAIQSADSAIAFGIPARVAMLSYSTGSSGTGEDVEKVKEATRHRQASCGPTSPSTGRCSTTRP